MRRRLLVAHFLKRLLDNDLLTPGADRHQVLSVTVASLISSGAFLTVAFSMKYLFSPIQSPGETALVTLDDVALMSGLSTIVMALVAVAEWDALSLDARDAAILGPLPVPARGLALAQLTALLLFAGVFSLTLNTLPAILMPLVRVSRLPVGASTILRLIAAQALATTAAGALGFAMVAGVRETLRATLGGKSLVHAAAIAQAALVVLLAIAFLALPALSSRVERRWAQPGRQARLVPPPVWFAGLYDRLGGDRLEHMPPTLPPRDAPAFGSILEFERTEAERYAQARARLAALGSRGTRAVFIVCLVALAAWGWNNRRLPQTMAAGVGGPRRRRPWAIERVLSRNQVTRAAIGFTLQTLSRSAQHRLVSGVALGVAIAVATLGLRTFEPRWAPHPEEIPLGALATPLLVLVVIMAGFRQACRIPASVRATPSFLMAWSGHRRAYVSGVQRVGILCGTMTIAAMAPLHVFVLGPRVAVWHAAFDLLLLGAMTRLLFDRARRLPLVSASEPSGNVIGLAPIYLVIVLAIVFAIAWIEREALGDASSSTILLASLALLWLGLTLTGRRRQEDDAPEWWAEAPAWETERLGLTE
jgi:hypothetical protein